MKKDGRYLYFSVEQPFFFYLLIILLLLYVLSFVILFKIDLNHKIKLL